MSGALRRVWGERGEQKKLKLVLLLVGAMAAWGVMPTMTQDEVELLQETLEEASWRMKTVRLLHGSEQQPAAGGGGRGGGAGGGGDGGRGSGEWSTDLGVVHRSHGVRAVMANARYQQFVRWDRVVAANPPTPPGRGDGVALAGGAAGEHCPAKRCLEEGSAE